MLTTEMPARWTLGSSRRIVHALGLVFLRAVLLFLVGMGIVGGTLLGDNIFSSGWKSFALVAGLLGALDVGLILNLGLLRFGKTTLRSLGWRFDTVTRDVPRGLAGFALCAVLILGAIVASGEQTLGGILGTIAHYSLSERVIFAVIGVCGGALVEESLFRGYLQPAKIVGVSVDDGRFFDDCRETGVRSSPCPSDPPCSSCSLHDVGAVRAISRRCSARDLVERAGCVDRRVSGQRVGELAAGVDALRPRDGGIDANSARHAIETVLPELGGPSRWVRHRDEEPVGPRAYAEDPPNVRRRRKRRRRPRPIEDGEPRWRGGVYQNGGESVRCESEAVDQAVRSDPSAVLRDELAVAPHRCLAAVGPDENAADHASARGRDRGVIVDCSFAVFETPSVQRAAVEEIRISCEDVDVVILTPTSVEESAIGT